MYHQSSWARDDLGQRERLGHDHDAEDAERERDLVADELGARAHRAQQRVLRVGGPAADDEAVDADRADREDQDQRDRDVGDLALDVDAEDLPARPERDHGEGRQGRERGDERRQDVEDVDGAEPGKKLSFRISFIRSAIGCRSPNGPARFGP